jgi:hypothetical protein
VLGRIFDSKREEITGRWRKLQDIVFHNLYSLPNIIRVIKSEVKRQLGRSRCRWEGNIKMDPSEVVYQCGLDSSGLVGTSGGVNPVMNLCIP